MPEAYDCGVEKTARTEVSLRLLIQLFPRKIGATHMYFPMICMLALTPPVSSGSNPPTHLDLRPTAGLIDVFGFAIEPPVPVNGDILRDQLDMVRNCNFTDGNANACSGIGVWGQMLGTQVCDDFVLQQECTITQVTGAFIGIAGTQFPDGANVTFYADRGGCQPLDAAADIECQASVSVSTFNCNDLYFEYYVTATLAGGITLPPGRWFIDIQPHDETGNGDFFYQLRNLNSPPTGCDSFLRDSLPNDPCCNGEDVYGVSTWTPAGAIYGAGDAAFQVVGKCGGGSCNGLELLRASCQDRDGDVPPEGDDQVTGKLTHATPGQAYTFCLDGGRCSIEVASARGVAKAKWKNVADGNHTVTVTECGLSALTACP